MLALALPLSYLHHMHLAPVELRPRARPGRYVDMDLMPCEAIDERAAVAALPPLIKGYVRAGCLVGDGAVIDYQFHTIDVCVVLRTNRVNERFRQRYEGGIGEPAVSQRYGERTRSHRPRNLVLRALRALDGAPAAGADPRRGVAS